MSNTFTAETNYDITAEDAFERHIDEAFVREKFDALGARDVSVDVVRDGDDVTMTVDRKTDVDVPGFAKRIVKPTNSVHLVEVWRRDGEGFTCDWHAETSPAPARLKGTRVLTPTGSGVTDRTEGAVEVKVPLIGGKLGDWLSGEAEREVSAELAWLEEQHG